MLSAKTSRIDPPGGRAGPACECSPPANATGDIDGWPASAVPGLPKASESIGVSKVSITWALLGAAALAAPAIWSRPFGRWPRTRPLTALLATLSAAAAAALIPVPALAVTASAVAFGGTFLAVPAAITALIRSATPPSQWTSALAAFTVIFAVGQICGPILAGALADRFGTGATLVWAAALCAAGAALSTISRTKGQRP